MRAISTIPATAAPSTAHVERRVLNLIHSELMTLGSVTGQVRTSSRVSACSAMPESMVTLMRRCLLPGCGRRRGPRCLETAPLIGSPWTPG